MHNPGQHQNDMLKEYSDVFEGLGPFPGVHKIHLKPDAVPVIHPLTLEDRTLLLSGAKYFSVLDATSGYWQIKLDDESSMLTTFNTLVGRYRFTHMPFGIHSAQEVFPKTMDMAFKGIEGCKSIIDDMLIWGTSKQDHDRNLKRVLDRSTGIGIKRNTEKCVIGTNKVSYFGHVLSDKGVQLPFRKWSLQGTSMSWKPCWAWSTTY